MIIFITFISVNQEWQTQAKKREKGGSQYLTTIDKAP